MNLRLRLLATVAAAFLIPTIFLLSFQRAYAARETALATLLEKELPAQLRWAQMSALLWDLRGLPALYSISGREAWAAEYARRKGELDGLLATAQAGTAGEAERGAFTALRRDIEGFYRVNDRALARIAGRERQGLKRLILGESYRALLPAQERLAEISARSVRKAQALQAQSSELAHAMHAALWAAVLGYCLGLAGVLYIGVMSAARLARLARGVSLIGRGALAHRLAARGQDEIGAIELGFNRMGEALGRARERLRRFGQVDGLTGAYNRRYLRRELARSQRHGHAAVILFDIDHFKSYNDNNGHPAGDEALKKVARLARECCGRKGRVVRYGGEEFLVLLPGGREARARQMAEQIRRRVARASFAGERRQPGGRLTVSLGLAAGETAARRLIKRADEALYRAKRAGRNRVS